MLNRNAPYGVIGGQHEFNAAFEQYGRLYDINGYEIDTKTGQLLEGPASTRPPKVKAEQTQQPAAQPVQETENPLQAAVASASSIDEAIAALLRMKGQEQPPVGLSMQGLNNPPPAATDQQSGEQAPPPGDIVRDGINLSAFARGELPGVDFNRVKPIIETHFGKKAANTSQAIKIIKAGLPEQ